MGTNGIATTLWAGEPMFVHGSEHFVESLKEWSFAASPIRERIDKTVIGAVDLSGLTKIFRHHNTAFAAAAAGWCIAAASNGWSCRTAPNWTHGTVSDHMTGAHSPEAVASALPEGLGFREVGGLQMDGELRGLAPVLPSGRGLASSQKIPACSRR